VDCPVKFLLPWRPPAWKSLWLGEERERGGFMLGLNHEKIKKERLWEAWSRNDGRR
jgi:hypothetical protein